MLKNLKPQDWISAIRLWPGLTADEEESICKAIKHFIPQVDCEKSDLFSGPDSPSKLSEIILTDLEQSADSSWTDGEDEIPKALKIP